MTYEQERIFNEFKDLIPEIKTVYEILIKEKKTGESGGIMILSRIIAERDLYKKQLESK